MAGEYKGFWFTSLYSLTSHLSDNPFTGRTGSVRILQSTEKDAHSVLDDLVALVVQNVVHDEQQRVDVATAAQPL